MVITEPGMYELVDNLLVRGTISTAVLKRGTIIEITQIDAAGHKVIGPALGDWHPWDLPVVPVRPVGAFIPLPEHNGRCPNCGVSAENALILWRQQQEAKAAARVTRQPKVGDLVLYQRHGSPNGQHKSEPSPAVITAVHGDAGTVDLFVINPTGLYFDKGTRFNALAAPGTWRWRD